MANRLYEKEVISSIVKKIKSLIDRDDESFTVSGANNLLDDAASAKVTVLSILRKIKSVMEAEGIETTTSFPIDECNASMDNVKAVPPYVDCGTVTISSVIGNNGSFVIHTDLYDGRVPETVMWTYDGTCPTGRIYITDSYYHNEGNMWGGGNKQSFDHYFAQWGNTRANGNGLLNYTFDASTGDITVTVNASSNNNGQTVNRYIPAGNIRWTVFSRLHNDQSDR